MPSQFTKRKSKMTEPVTEVKADVVVKSEPALYPYSGYDVFSPDGGGTFRLAEIQYNPETGEAKVVQTYEISRMIGLQYANNKSAMGILKKQRRQAPRSPE